MAETIHNTFVHGTRKSRKRDRVRQRLRANPMVRRRAGGAAAATSTT